MMIAYVTVAAIQLINATRAERRQGRSAVCAGSGSATAVNSSSQVFTSVTGWDYTAK
ncbi:hypothetical protein KRMM14A1259_24320 [Krasilnikovia sp. MM14-A1259]